MTDAERPSALREVHKLVHNDAPMAFLWTLDSYAALSVKRKPSAETAMPWALRKVPARVDAEPESEG